MLPIKARMLQIAYEWDRPFKVDDMAEVLKKEYKNEKTTEWKEIDKQLEMYCRVDMLESTNVEIDDKDNLIVTYKITNTGKESAKKYVPGTK